jgi:hypothetical protein
MYTESMARAFHSVSHFAPRNFSLAVIDNDHFITLRAGEKEFMSLNYEDKLQAIQYMVLAKKALEDQGAIVLLVREGGEEQ